ncbi:hypothetical protein [Bradyrhizobium sp. WSM2254]|uniref:hypothetical protein n=1 Tax=Bradyrhizobium sp. WSM2254 TaxID=1188263 RepID=UPI00042901D1|nr:hypothetical protein [Bradyrhizobium sp. WSM2254]
MADSQYIADSAHLPHHHLLLGELPPSNSVTRERVLGIGSLPPSTAIFPVTD